MRKAYDPAVFNVRDQYPHITSEALVNNPMIVECLITINEKKWAVWRQYEQAEAAFDAGRREIALRRKEPGAQPAIIDMDADILKMEFSNAIYKRDELLGALYADEGPLWMALERR